MTTRHLCQDFPVVFLHNMIKWLCRILQREEGYVLRIRSSTSDVEGNLELSRGDRLEYSCGSIRRSKADLYGFRAFVLTDKDRGVTYRVMRKGMVVEWPGGSSFVRNPEELKRTPFAGEGGGR